MSVEMHRIVSLSYQVFSEYGGYKGTFKTLKSARAIRSKDENRYIERIWTETTTLTSRTIVR
jgi:hypothetical protein